MHFRSFGLAIGICALVLGLLGCKGESSKNTATDSESSTDSTPPSSTSDSDANNDSETAEDPNAWIATFDAPAEWAEVADCGTIGAACPNLSGCGDDTICQSMGDVCVPDMTEEGRTSGPEYPYCMSWVCMTYEEASCYCAGVGGELYPETCAGGPQAMLGLCSMEKESCSEQSCCGDLDCIEVSPIQTSCQQHCVDAEDCDSGCCTDLWGNGTLVCATMSECENSCLSEGGACETSSDCCLGTCVTSTDPNSVGCRQTCTEHTDCYSNCCIMFTDASYGFCADAARCACTANSESCYQSETETVIPCCNENSACTGDSADPASLTCKPMCDVNTDCSTNCCIPVNGTDYGVCDDASRCM